MDLKYIINHVFLPPELPQKDDSDFLHGVGLIEELESALSSFQSYLPHHQRSRWSSCIKMVREMLETRDGFGKISTKALEKSLKSMLDGGESLSQH
jgi:hypothetical protein